jgi:lipid-binding SYLF domain-containing protein
VKNTILRGAATPILTTVALLCALALPANASDDRAKQQGCAVFSDLGVKIRFGGTGNGKGVAINNKTRHETYMKMVELQAGLGVGVDKFRVVFVFDNQRAFDGFVNSGWEFGGQSTLAAKAGDNGGAMAGAVAVADGVWMYQLTDTGLAVDISATGTKYYNDDDLN